MLSALLAMGATASMEAQQPYSGCWFPDDVINWSPENDPDAKFNRSRIPLATRFTEPQLMKAHSGQSYTGYVETATITNKMCSLMPSQGDNNFLGYQPTYWQYLEKFINWGGAGNEGIFVLPPAGTIDAAHMNGVKILGELFFMPRSIGGREEWINAMLTKDSSGKYPFAIKMYEIAKYFGFDGWFVNKELNTHDRENEWADFITCFNEAADNAGDTYMEIQWYNASQKPTIEILKSHKNTSQFLEYHGTGDKSSYAAELGCSPEDILHRLYSGIETVKDGQTGYDSDLSTVHQGSIALFCPEQHNYKDFTDKMWENGQITGQDAYDAQVRAFANENLTWTNSTGNPANTSGTWKGVSGYVLERSVINSMPFTTSFCVGNGKHRFVKGEKLNTQDWYSTSAQSILPTWRYWLENQGSAKVSIDWDDAYNFGNSIKLSGDLSAGDHLWRLYKTMIPVVNGGKAILAFKCNGATPELKLSTESSVNPDVTIAASSTKSENGWTVAEYSLSSVNGKTIYLLALNLNEASAKSGYELKLGGLTIVSDGYKAPAMKVSDFNVSGNGDLNSTDIRATWSYDYNNDFDHFDLYLNNGGNRNLVGQTRGEGFYIPRFNRNGSAASVKVELVAVMKDGTQQNITSQDYTFAVETAPVITIIPTKSYIKVGEIVNLTAMGTYTPTSFQWTLPESVKLVSGKLTDATIQVEALAEGSQNISVKVGNAVGISSFDGTAFEVFSDVLYKEINNAAPGKVADCSRAVTGSADFLIDGVVKPNSSDNCWSDISTNPYAVIDLKTLHTIYTVNIYDSRSAFKGGAENAENYRLYVSANGKDWTLVREGQNTKNENIHEVNMIPTVARYVKYEPYADKRFTSRVYEIEVIGRDNSRITIETPNIVNMVPGEKQTVTVDYNMNGESIADNFGLQVECESSFIEVGNPTCDNNGHFTFDVQAANRIGKATLNLSLTNGDVKRQTFVDVILDSDKAVNELAGKTAVMRKYVADYASDVKFDAQETVNLTDGNRTAEGLTEDMYEDPCTSRNDLWAVFTNPELFNIGKVKVYFPENNKGVSANDKEGYVNNNISIRRSTNGVNWTVIEEFNNIKDVSELTCYLPDVAPFAYLAIVCDVNTFFYPSMSEVEAYTQLEDAGNKFIPFAVAEGFNHDVICENTPFKQYAEKAFNYGAFFTSNVNEQYSLTSPDARKIISHQGVPFLLGKFDEKNVASIESKSESRELRFENPLAAENLHILSARISGSANIIFTINYEDGSNEEVKVNSANIPRADYSASEKDKFAFTDLRTKYNDKGIDNTTYGLFDIVLDADESKAISSLKIGSDKNCELYVFAVTAFGDPHSSKMSIHAESDNIALAPEETGEIVLTYNLNGEERAANFALEATVDGNVVTLGAVSEDKTANTFTIPVMAGDEAGTAVVNLLLTNGENTKECKVTVSVSVPTEFTGWNADVIVEALPASEHATGKVDGEELALFTADVNPTGAIAGSDRVVTSESGNKYVLADYDKDNALILESYEEHTLTAVIPEECTEVHILAISDRSSDITITANYEDGTASEPVSYTVNSWGSEGNGLNNINLINVSTYSWTYDNDEIDTDPCGITEIVVTVDDTKKLKGLTIEKESSRPSTTILAVSKVGKLSGIDSVDNDADHTVVGIYNLNGVKVENPVPGLYIVKYSDGSVKKILIK